MVETTMRILPASVSPNLRYSLLAIAKLELKVTRPISYYLFGLGW
jgi:hypothetical protein